LRLSEVREYLDRASQMEIIPNFWLTEQYLAIQNAKLQSNGKVMWVQEDDWAIFPPLPLCGNSLMEIDCPPMKIWSDFENYSVGKVMGFLDWEYTYNSDNFLNMKGGKWQSFRKNCRKWPRANNGWTYNGDAPTPEEISGLLIKWLEKHEGEIEDSESLIWFVENCQMRAFLRRGGELVGVNVWDGNGAYLMYRYCITDPDEPYLDEFTRSLFYQSTPGRLVIDGGCLGNPGLERFKDKLNPIKKREVYSRIMGQGGEQSESRNQEHIRDMAGSS
jgi:hypothetical protein